MNPRLADYIKAGETLDADEREVAALSLQRVDEAEQAGIDAAWRVEVRSRLDDVLNGTVELVDADEHMAQIRAMLAARRR